MSQFDKLDELILDRINCATGATFLEIDCNHAVAAETYRLGEATGRVGWRILDARIQALRKAGRIRFDRPVWRLADGVKR